MVKLKRNIIRKGIGHRYVMGQVMPSERAKYLQTRINRLDRFIRAQKAIGLSYGGMKKILEEFLGKINETGEGGSFDKGKRVRYPRGKHRNELVWNLEENPIKEKAEFYKARLESILDNIKKIDKMDIRIEEEEAKIQDTASGEFEDMMKRIDVKFKHLIDILRKFDKIWKHIKELEDRKNVIEKIKDDFSLFKKSIDKDSAYIYNDENRGHIDEIRKDLEELERINGELSGDLEREAKIVGDEKELVDMLIRGLVRSDRRFKKVTKIYEGFYVHSDILPRYSHFETNLNKEEQRIIIYHVTPLITRLYHLTADFIKLIKDENDKIGEFARHVIRIHNFQDGGEQLNEDEKRELYIKFKRNVIELNELIKGKEGPLAQKIEQVEKMIEGAVNKVKEVEAKREGIIREVEKKVTTPEVELETSAK